MEDYLWPKYVADELWLIAAIADAKRAACEGFTDTLEAYSLSTSAAQAVPSP